MELDVRLRISVKLVGLINASTEVDLYLPHLKKSIVISVPNSISKKDTLRLKGMGNISPDGEKGNLYLEFDNIDNSNVYSKAGTCSNCGHELAHGAEYCFKCGSKVGESNKSNNQRQQRWAGEIIECPRCGEVLKSFEINCPSCGHELRGASATASVKKFYDEYKNAVNDDERENIIRHSPIPNTKEDIYSFINKAVAEIKTVNTYKLMKAWQSRLEQEYQNAKLMFKEGSSELADITNKYNEAIQIIANKEKARNQAANREEKRKQRSQNIKNVGNFLSSVVDVFSELLPIMPNLLLSTIWLATLFFLIPICVVDPTYEFIFVLDLVLGAVLAPLALRCDSHTPRIITILGLVLSIIILIIVYKEFEVVIFFDIVCSAVVIFRMFRKRSDDYQSVDEKASVIAIISTIILLLIIFGISSIRAHFIEPDKSTSTSSIASEKRSDWLTNGLSVYLPFVQTNNMYVWENSDCNFSATVLDIISYEEFEAYIIECKEMGYTIDAQMDTNSYSAYNDKNYYLEVSHIGNLKIDLTVPPEGEENFLTIDNALTKTIPTIENKKGKVINNNSEEIVFIVCDVEGQDFNTYVSKCKEIGYSIDTESYSDYFEAYNSNGNLISITRDIVKVMTVTIKAPKIFEELKWPTMGLAKLIPKPNSTKGEVKIDSESQLFIYIGDVTKEEYDEYVDDCIEKGFKVDYDRNEKVYSAHNKKGDSLRVEYEGNNTILISMYAHD